MRKSQSGEGVRQGQTPDIVKIQLRQTRVNKLGMLGDWKSDLIEDKGNASAAGTLVELNSGYLIPAKMRNAIASSDV